MQDEATGCKAAAIVRGGGELGTAVAYALHKAGLRVLVVDRPLPGALRLGAAFAAAAVSGCAVVGGVAAVHCATRAQCEAAWRRGEVPLWTGPEDDLGLRPELLVDARMRGVHGPRAHMDEAPLVVGIGPGFEAGRDVHLVIESNRGPRLGQVLSRGSAEPHTGIPGEVMGHREERVLRAPCAGRMERARELGDFVAAGDVVATVAGEPVRARIGGMIRGLKLTGVEVGAGHKVGDVDPRQDRALLTEMTDKARAVGRAAVRAAESGGLLPAGAGRALSSPASVREEVP